MIPIRDDAPRYGTPYINYFLLAMNVAVFLLMWVSGPNAAGQIADTFAFRPRYLTGFVFQHDVNMGLAALITIFTSMFMHSGLWHLVGNMWVLFIFGDNVEDYLGHFSYLIFYLASGICAMLLHTLLNLQSPIPAVGASGAIAGVMGAYFILFPSARVLVPVFFFIPIWLPAWIVLGYWILTQFLSGAATSIAYSNQSGGGIAFWAHVGGFAAGLVMVKVFPAKRRRFRYDSW